MSFIGSMKIAQFEETRIRFSFFLQHLYVNNQNFFFQHPIHMSDSPRKTFKLFPGYKIARQFQIYKLLIKHLPAFAPTKLHTVRARDPKLLENLARSRKEIMKILMKTSGTNRVHMVGRQIVLKFDINTIKNIPPEKCSYNLIYYMYLVYIKLQTLNTIGHLYIY